MYIMPAGRQVAAELGPDDPAAAVSWINRDTDIHKVTFGETIMVSRHNPLAISGTKACQNRQEKNDEHKAGRGWARGVGVRIRLGLGGGRRAGRRGFCFRDRRGRAFLPDQIDDAGIVIGEKESVRAKFKNVAGTARDASAVEKSADEILQRFALSHDDDLVAASNRLVRGPMQGDEEGPFYQFGCVRVVEIVETEGGTSRREIRVRSGYAFTAAGPIQLRIGKYSAVRGMTIRPAVIGAVLHRVKSFVRFLQPEMVGTLVRREKEFTVPSEPDRVPQPFCENALLGAVRIHFQDRRPDLFLFLAGIAARTDRNVHLPVRRKRYRPRQVPAAVFIAEPVVREGRERLRIGVGRLLLSFREFAAGQL